MENLENNLNNTGAVELTETVEENEDKITMTREELDSLLQKTADARVTQALKTQERKNAEKLRESQKIAAMNAEERYKYELDQREAKIAAKERELLMAENRNECAKILSSKGLSLDFVDYVVAETAEDMQTNIKTIERAFKQSVKAEVEKRLAAKAPATSMAVFNGISQADFSKMTLAQLQQLADSEPDTYRALASR